MVKVLTEPPSVNCPPQSPLRDAQIALLARQVAVYRKLRALPEPQPHEIAMVEHHYAYLIGMAS